jgi:DNA-binding IclR family transcriptional regulator
MTSSTTEENSATEGEVIQSVEVAVRILEAMAQSPGPVRVTQMAKALGLSKPRVCRHLATLERLDMVRRSGRQGYLPGSRFVHLGHTVIRTKSVTEVLLPALRALRDSTGHTATLSVPGSEGAVVLLCIESQQGPSIRVRPGTSLRYPHSPAARLAVALEREAQGSPAPRDAATWGAQRWRSEGADFEIDTQGTGIGGLAAPVFQQGRLAAIVSLVLSSGKLKPRPPQALLRAIGDAVQAMEACLKD